MIKKKKKKPVVVPIYHCKVTDKFDQWQRKFIESQEPLGAEFQKVYNDNKWYLYES